MTDKSVFYRVTEHEWVGDSMISGNPNSMAKIANHLALEENPYYARMRSFALKCPDGDERAQMLQTLENCDQYRPLSMYASDLPDPSLNVMFGSNAAEGVRGYLKDGKVVVKMTLGDIREAGGGLVFFDTKAARNNPGSIPLIVTLPAGAKVPVEIL